MPNHYTVHTKLIQFYVNYISISKKKPLPFGNTNVIANYSTPTFIHLVIYRNVL